MKRGRAVSPFALIFLVAWLAPLAARADEPVSTNAGASVEPPKETAPKDASSKDPASKDTATKDPASTDPAPKNEPPKPEVVDDAQQRSLALEKGRRAMNFFRAQDYEQAYSFFRDANELFHTPQLVLYMARCQDKRGKLLEARALYERVLAEPLPDSPSESLLRARQAATAELGPVRLRIPSLAVDVRGPPAAEVTVFVDGEVWPLEEPREIDPGSHEVEALSRSGARTSRSMELPEGRSISTVLRIGLFARTPTQNNDSLATPEQPLPSWRFVVAGGAFTVGLVGLGVGVTTGILAIQQKGFVEDECIDTQCSKKGFDAAQRADTFATWCDASLAVAALGMATGVAVLVWGANNAPAVRAGIGTVGKGTGVFLGGAF